MKEIEEDKLKNTFMSVEKGRKQKLRKLTLCALFLALCLLGANVKLFQNTIALDSTPAFLGALILGPSYGAFLGAAGHLLSAVFSGMPMTPVVHLIIAVAMALIMIVYAYMGRKLKYNLGTVIIRDLLAVLLNSVVAQLPLIPFLGWQMVLSLILPLAIGSVVNLILAELIYFALRKLIKFLPQGGISNE